jgi:hypothetical protein
MSRLRIDDATAHVDHFFAHAALALSCAVAGVALTVPGMRRALVGAVIIGVVSALRLVWHPLRLTSLARVYVETGAESARVLVAHALGVPRLVEVVSVEHDDHAPWPCRLHLADGSAVAFVARRDDGSLVFFDFELNDRARYERPRDARDSLTHVERTVRVSRPAHET